MHCYVILRKQQWFSALRSACDHRRSWFDTQMMLFPWTRNFTHIALVNLAELSEECDWARNFTYIIPAVMDTWQCWY